MNRQIDGFGGISEHQTGAFFNDHTFRVYLAVHSPGTLEPESRFANESAANSPGDESLGAYGQCAADMSRVCDGEIPTYVDGPRSNRGNCRIAQIDCDVAVGAKSRSGVLGDPVSLAAAIAANRAARR